MTLNIMGVYVHNDRKPALKQHLVNTQPGALLVLDDIAFAVELNRLLPKTKVVFRAWYPPSDADGDNNQHTRVKDPREVLNFYKGVIPANEDIYGHFNNEPGASDELFDWLDAAAAYTAEERRFGCYYNASVGTPEKADWRRPSARRFLARIGQNKTRHVLGLHQYIPTLVHHEFGMSPNPATWPDRVVGSPSLIGRHRDVFEVCDTYGIPRPRIVLTEFGFDYIHAVESWQQSLPKTPGKPDVGALWRNIAAWESVTPSGWTWPRYMVEQMHWCWRAIYKPDGIEGICTFCYGSHGHWAEYDNQDVPNFFQLMEQKDWRPMTTSTPAPAPSHWLDTLKWNTGMNFRAEADTSAAQIGFITKGTTVTVIGGIKVNDGYSWVNVSHGGKSGWVALGAVTP